MAAACLDKIYTLSINTWLWRILGINLLVANKNDILSGRLVVVVVVHGINCIIGFEESWLHNAEVCITLVAKYVYNLCMEAFWKSY